MKECAAEFTVRGAQHRERIWMRGANLQFLVGPHSALNQPEGTQIEGFRFTVVTERQPTGSSLSQRPHVVSTSEIERCTITRNVALDDERHAIDLCHVEKSLKHAS